MEGGLPSVGLPPGHPLPLVIIDSSQAMLIGVKTPRGGERRPAVPEHSLGHPTPPHIT